MAKKIAIIGAGPGGLTAAMILARRGFAVTLFEARDRVGGRNALIEQDGFRFDTGPTFLMLKFVLDQMFAGKVKADVVLKMMPADNLNSDFNATMGVRFYR